MDTREMLNNIRTAAERVLAQRLIVSSPSEKVADVPLVYAAFLALSAAPVCILAFVLGLIRRYSLRLERDTERRA